MVQQAHPVARQRQAVAHDGARVDDLHRVRRQRPAVEILAGDADVPGGAERPEAAVQVAPVIQDDDRPAAAAAIDCAQPLQSGDRWSMSRPSGGERKHVEVAERRRRHLRAEDRREVRADAARARLARNRRGCCARPRPEARCPRRRASPSARRWSRRRDARTCRCARACPSRPSPSCPPRAGSSAGARRSAPLDKFDRDAVHAVLEAAARVDDVPARGQLQPDGPACGCRPRRA